MNRTGVFLASAAVLTLIAVTAAGVPQLGTAAPPPPAPPAPVTKTTQGTLRLTARVSHPFVSIGRQDVFATVDVGALELPGQSRGPVNLALVIDRSGSMSGFKLEQARKAARQLVSQLNERDRLAIVHYGSDVRAFDGVAVTAENRGRLLAYIDTIVDDGGTNISSGLAAGRDQLLSAPGEFRVNRIVLISDGQPTEGETDFGALTAQVRSIRSQGVSVSAIGVGDDFNERLMEGFAEVGAGAYAYLQDASQLSAIFQKDLNAAGTQVARQVSVTLRVPRGARLQRVLGYTQVSRRFDGDAELITVALPDFAAGQQERLVAHLQLDAMEVGASVDVSAIDLEYSDLLKDGRTTHDEARLAAMTTDRQEVVQQNRDKDAVVFAARAQAADNSQKAAEKLAAGDRAGALKLLEENKVVFDEAAGVAGAGALADDYANSRGLIDGVKSAQGEAGGKAMQKTMRKQARKDFGLMGSTY